MDGEQPTLLGFAWTMGSTTYDNKKGNAISSVNKHALPPAARIFLGIVFVIVGVSILNVILSWVFFDDFAKDYVQRHPESFAGIDSDAARRRAIGILLGMRGLFALGWIGSVLYLWRVVAMGSKHLVGIVVGYGLVGIGGYGWMLLRGGAPWQEVLWSIQVAGSALVLSLPLIGVFRGQLRELANACTEDGDAANASKEVDRA